MAATVGGPPISTRLRMLRGLARMTQRALAERLDVEPAAIRRWERGSEQIPSRPRAELAELFEVTPEFLTGDESRSDSAPVAAPGCDTTIEGRHE